MGADKAIYKRLWLVGSCFALILIAFMLLMETPPGSSSLMASIRRLHFDAIIAFGPLHLACVFLFWIPFKWSYVAWLLGTYVLRMFAVTAGYHRYFSHRSYKLGRVTQFLLGFLAETSAQ